MIMAMTNREAKIILSKWLIDDRANEVMTVLMMKTIIVNGVVVSNEMKMVAENNESRNNQA